MRENFARLAFYILMAFIALLVLAQIARAMSVISIDVKPTIFIASPYKKTFFRVRYSIQPHPDNRKWTLVVACLQGDYRSSTGDLDEHSPMTTQVEFTIQAGTGCAFEACVIRNTGKVFQCARQNVTSPEEPP